MDDPTTGSRPTSSDFRHPSARFCPVVTESRRLVVSASPPVHPISLLPSPLVRGSARSSPHAHVLCTPSHGPKPILPF